MMWQEDFEGVLRDAIGLDPETVGAGVIRKAYETRMADLGLKDVGSYLALVRQPGDELQALIEEVVIPESWFFRDSQPFSLLQRLARERWLHTPNAATLRVLSLPCARGEEPYSVAMALLEIGIEPGRFEIDAVDVSQRSVDRARRGIYGVNAFRGNDQPFRKRYFRPLGTGFEIDPAVKAAVRFHCGNLVDPLLLGGCVPYDFIFFRNLLIYLDVPTRKQAIRTLDRLLGASGILFSGHAESLSGYWPALVPMADVGTFAYRRMTEQDRVVPFHDLLDPPRIKAIPAPARPREIRSTPGPAPVAPPAALTSRPHVAITTTAPPTPARRTTPAPCPLLERASELANQRQYDAAISLCERAQRESGQTADSYYLMGMIQQAASRPALAEVAFNKAVYLDGQHDEALLALALLAQRRGDVAAAEGLRKRADRASQRKGKS